MSIIVLGLNHRTAPVELRERLAFSREGAAAAMLLFKEQFPGSEVAILSTCNRVELIVSADHLEDGALAERQGRPLLLIDLAVPRNIDPEVRHLPGVTLLDVDALGNIVESFRRQRASAVENSEQIIEEEVGGFERWLSESKVGPLIEQMYSDVRALAEIEVRGMFRKCPDLTEEQRAAVEHLADRLVAKLMHPCVRTVRETQAGEPAMMLAEAFHSTRVSVTQPSVARGSA